MTCGVVLGQTRFTCDREQGHGGQHRTYFEQIDEPVFWSERTIRMDTRDGTIYDSRELAEAAGVPDEDLVTGSTAALEKLRTKLVFTKGSFKKVPKTKRSPHDADSA